VRLLACSYKAIIMEEKVKLVIVQALEIRQHAVGSCWGEQRGIFPAGRNHVGIGAVEKNMLLLILDIFFFFWWGLLHGPQQGPDRKKEKYL